jgi:hypothetical protein
MHDLLGVAVDGPRGFPAVTFKDAYEHDCTLMASSAIGDYDDSFDRPGSSFLWIGLDDAMPKVMARDAASVGISTDETVGWVPYPIPDQVNLWTRMHLNREQVRGLIGRLEQWLEHGDFNSPNDEVWHS